MHTSKPYLQPQNWSWVHIGSGIHVAHNKELILIVREELHKETICPWKYTMAVPGDKNRTVSGNARNKAEAINALKRLISKHYNIPEIPRMPNVVRRQPHAPQTFP